MSFGRDKTVGRSPTARLVYSLTGVGEKLRIWARNKCLYFKQLLVDCASKPVYLPSNLIYLTVLFLRMSMEGVYNYANDKHIAS